MRTTSRKSLALIGAAGLALAGAGATALATPGSGEAPTPLARGALLQPVNANVKVQGARVKVQTKGALDAMMLQITLAPGGNGGWHKHAGPLFTIVKQGTLTIIDARCKRHDITAGSASFSPGSSASKDENLGTTPVAFDVTFLLPHGVQSPRIDQPAPAGCNA